jgi:hypothetical protein
MPRRYPEYERLSNDQVILQSTLQGWDRMFFYYGRTAKATRLGSRVVPVVCEHCGCEYYYELVRVGSGEADAPYGLGRARAERRAAEKAEKDLKARLAGESEMVPCPTCLWINEELVAGHRRGLGRGWGGTAVAIALTGGLLTPVVAGFTRVGPQPGPGAGETAGTLAIGLGGTAALVLAILGLRAWLRARVQPNRDHPLAPQVLPGTPSPLVADPATGQLVPVKLPPEATGDRAGWVHVQVGRSTFPGVCCDCLNVAEPDCFYQHYIFTSLYLRIPLCRACIRRWERRYRRLGLQIFAVLGGLAYVALLPWKLEELTFWLLFGTTCGVAPLVAYVVAKIRTTPVSAKVVDESRAIVRLRFRNPDYLECLGEPAAAGA